MAELSGAGGELANDRDPSTEAAHILAFELSMNVYEMLNPGRLTPEQLTDHVDRFIDWMLRGRSGEPHRDR